MILGILLRRSANPAAPFGALTGFAERVAAQAPAAGARIIAFSEADFDKDTGRLTAGHFEGPERGWSFQETPLPDVVWDRTFQWGDGGHLRPFLNHGVLPLNRRRLDKWEAHRLLTRAPLIHNHLPETRRLSSTLVLDELLRAYPAVFIKPVAGSVGRGIIRVTSGGIGCIRLQYIAAGSGRPREVYASLDQLDRWLRRRAGAYIAQQGLDLKIWSGRPADVRVLVQKDGRGQWQVTGMGARVAATERFTTNLHTGGRGIPIGHLLGAIGRPELEGDLQRLALSTAAALDRGAGPLGELGLDFAVDPRGRVWFIEQNGQPGRSIFTHLHRQDLADLAHRRPVQYAAYLARSRQKSGPITAT